MTAFGIAVRWLHLACGLGLVGLVTALLLAGRSDRPPALAWEARMLRWARALAGLLIVSGLGAQHGAVGVDKSPEYLACRRLAAPMLAVEVEHRVRAGRS